MGYIDPDDCRSQRGTHQCFRHDVEINAGALYDQTTIAERQPFEGLVQGSVVCMSGIIDDVLDFARGRLGGLTLDRQDGVLLEPVLQHLAGWRADMRWCSKNQINAFQAAMRSAPEWKIDSIEECCLSAPCA